MSRITDDVGITSVVKRKSLVSRQLYIVRRSEGSGPGDVVAAANRRKRPIGNRDVSTGEGNNRLREYHR